MKTRSANSFHGEPSRTTRRKGLTEQPSANATHLSNIIFKSHDTASAAADLLEEEEKLLMSMEAAAGWAA